MIDWCKRVVLHEYGLQHISILINGTWSTSLRMQGKKIYGWLHLTFLFFPLSFAIIVGYKIFQFSHGNWKLYSLFSSRGVENQWEVGALLGLKYND